ncbi:MAG: ABC transporter permease [Planctomycetes bacterium]|nr:ABC transporter permease [Planctomycetota bacterium]
MIRDLIRFFRKHRPAQAGFFLILLVVLAAVLAPILTDFGPKEPVSYNFFESPSAAHWFGLDGQGYDLFARMVYGARTTLRIALLATLLSLLLGATLGAVSGYFGGWTDLILMRVVDFMMSFPSFLLAVVMVAILGRSLDNLVWAVGIVGTPMFARQMRAEVLRVKQMEYVEAARALGFGHIRILFRTVIPNCLTPLIVLSTLGMGGAILDVAGLAFLGLGGDPFAPEWGLILKAGWNAPGDGSFQVGVAGVAILLTVLGFNLLGDGLRDWLDPRTRSK